LQGKDLDEVPVVRLGPDLRLVLDADQLRGDPDTVPSRRTLPSTT